MVPQERQWVLRVTVHGRRREMGLGSVSEVSLKDARTAATKWRNLPSMPGLLIIATDWDDPGRAAGNALAERASPFSWDVSMLPAPLGFDWKDVLTGKAVAA